MRSPVIRPSFKSESRIVTRPPHLSSRHRVLPASLIGVAFAGVIGGQAIAAEPTASPAGVATVTVAKATSACFSDMVRVTGFVVPRKLALVNVDSEGSKVTDVLVREGDMVTDNQELARLQPPSAPGSPARPIVSLRAPAAGLILQVRTIAGAPASTQSEPMFRIAVGNEIELEAEVPGLHMLKLNPGATARVGRDGEPDISGRVRLVSPEINRTTQLGNVRIALPSLPNVQGRHVRPRQHRRATKLRCGDPALGAGSPDGAGRQRQHDRNAPGALGTDLRHVDRNHRRPERG